MRQFDFDLSPFPGGDRAVILGHLYSDTPANADRLAVFFNEDLVERHYYAREDAANMGALNRLEHQEPRCGGCPGNTAPQGSFATFQMVLEAYSGNLLKQAAFENAYQTQPMDMIYRKGWVVSEITQPITRVRIRSYAYPQHSLYGTLDLYIEMQGHRVWAGQCKGTV